MPLFIQENKFRNNFQKECLITDLFQMCCSDHLLNNGISFSNITLQILTHLINYFFPISHELKKNGLKPVKFCLKAVTSLCPYPLQPVDSNHLYMFPTSRTVCIIGGNWQL